MRKIKLFWETDFEEWSQARIRDLSNEVNREPEDYLLNVNESSYLEHLVSEYALTPLTIHFDAAYATDEERLIPAERFPPTSFVRHGGRYPKQVFTFHIPFSGSIDLFVLRPSPRLMWSMELDLNQVDNTICFDVIRFAEDMDAVNRTYDDIVNKIKQQLQNLSGNVERYNGALKDRAREIFAQRRTALQKKADLRSALRVPIRKNTAPATFAVPVSSPKRIAPKPKIDSSRYSIDPTLDSTIYREILQLIHDLGKQLERLPETYKDKDEETLRDYFLLVLQPHFGIEGSATGETFNASGKTDILIRFQNQNLFVAEFKFWRGAKQHSETIAQLLSYLTWRDSKTAIVYFFDGKEVTAPLKAIEDATPQNQHYVKLLGRPDHSWFNYELRLPDSDKNVQVAVLCFHLPK